LKSAADGDGKPADLRTIRICSSDRGGDEHAGKRSAFSKIVLVVLAAIVAAAVNPWLERVKARTAANYWEAQERWKFRAQVYAKALTCLGRMRAPLEAAAIKGTWPPAEEWSKVQIASLDLIEPTMLARLWLSEEAVAPLKTLGDRLLGLRSDVHPGNPKPGPLKLCEMLEKEMEQLHPLAREDLKLQVAGNQPWWRLR